MHPFNTIHYCNNLFLLIMHSMPEWYYCILIFESIIYYQCAVSKLPVGIFSIIGFILNRRVSSLCRRVSSFFINSFCVFKCFNEWRNPHLCAAKSVIIGFCVQDSFCWLFFVLKIRLFSVNVLSSGIGCVENIQRSAVYSIQIVRF